MPLTEMLIVLMKEEPDIVMKKLPTVDADQLKPEDVDFFLNDWDRKVIYEDIKSEFVHPEVVVYEDKEKILREFMEMELDMLEMLEEGIEE